MYQRHQLWTGHRYKPQRGGIYQPRAQALGKGQAEGPSYLPEAGVQPAGRNDGIAFFYTGTEDRGENRLFPRPRAVPVWV